MGHSVCKLAGLQAQNDYQNPNRVFCMGKQHVLTYIPKYLIVGLAQTVYGIFIYRSYAVYDRIYTV